MIGKTNLNHFYLSQYLELLLYIRNNSTLQQATKISQN